MSMNQLKTQIMTIFAVKGGDNGSIITLIWGMIILSVFESFIQYIPIICTIIGAFIKKKMVKHVVPMTALSVEDTQSRIIFTRNYKSRQESTLVDSILDYICNQDNATDLIYNQFYLVNRMESFELTNDLTVKILDKKMKDDILESIIFEIVSTTWSLTKLKEWTSKIHDHYLIEMKNQFGSKRFFFDEFDVGSQKGMPIPPNLFFNVTQFHTNKSLSNTYGSHVDVVKSRVDLFINRPEWYEERGIPHTLGLLLHGPPGTGKTSLIKAIAKDTKRHIFNIKLRNYTTPEQLNDLFYSELVKLRPGSQFGHSVIVPLSQRIYVIEDIDCLTDVVFDRTLIDSEKKSDDEKSSRWTRIPTSDDDDKKERKKVEKPTLTLSFILNLLDGVLETPGRILIMTSNFPDKLDKALIRPGRVDINLCLGYCDDAMIKDMFDGFFGPSDITFVGLCNKEYTPAKVQEILCNNFDSSEKASEQIRS